MTQTKEEFCDLAAMIVLANPSVLDKMAQDAQVTHRAYAIAEALWNEKQRRAEGLTAAPVPQPTQYTGIPQAIPGQAYPQIPLGPNGQPAVAPVPGFNAMHQVDARSVVAQAGAQGHPYGPTVLATDMKGASISAQHPGGMVPGPMPGRAPIAEPRVLATDMQGATASAKNPIPGT